MNERVILLSHGGGGRRTHELIREIILRHLHNPILDTMDDGACLNVPEPDLVMSTDSFVVNPLFFPGGDIGKLAACGTINDLAMQGAEPRFLTLALILEEGFRWDDLDTIVRSLAAVVDQTGVRVVAGDIKVVERGKGNGLFINTTGLGVRMKGVDTHVANARPGDVVILNGPMGDHGVAVMSQREGLGLKTDVVSDVAPLWDLVRTMLAVTPSVHVLRDPTRGGVTAALCDIAEAARVGIRIQERSLPVRPAVWSVCRLLGLDPLTIANEGKALIVCAKEDAGAVLKTARAHPLGGGAVALGTVVSDHPGVVVMETEIGGERILEMPLGEDLPRIC